MNTIYTYLITALIAGVVSFGGAWKTQEWRYSAQIATMQKGAAEKTTKAVKEAMDKTAIDQKRKDDALIEANKRAQYNAVAADSARRAAVSLRDQLATARADLSSATLDAARNYAATLSDVFEQCIDEYRGLAEKATGHASDSMMYQTAWPKP